VLVFKETRVERVGYGAYCKAQKEGSVLAVDEALGFKLRQGVEPVIAPALVRCKHGAPPTLDGPVRLKCGGLVSRILRHKFRDPFKHELWMTWRTRREGGGAWGGVEKLRRGNGVCSTHAEWAESRIRQERQ
jgi:hypothetical protein